MGVFVKLIIDYDSCKGKKCGICIDMCPMDIFIKKNDTIDVNPKNEDECTFCEMCLESCPVNCIKIRKKY